MREFWVKDTVTIPIGRLGENESTVIIFDVKDYEQLFGVGVFELLHQRKGDVQPYPCVIQHVNDTVRWVVKDADVSVQGYGRCELIYVVNDVIAKSEIFTTVTGEALLGGTEPPEPYEDWVQSVLEAGAAAQASAAAASISADNASTSEQNASQSEQNAAASETAAEQAKDTALAALEAFHTPTASAVTLAPNEEAYAEYNGQDFVFGIPKGETGDCNFATFEIDPATGILSATYTTQSEDLIFNLNNGYLEVEIA